MFFFKSKPCENDLFYVDVCVTMVIHAMGASIHATLGSTIIATSWNVPVLTIV
jgi:hypothetical protein